MKGVDTDTRKTWRYTPASGAQVYDETGRTRAALADPATIQRGASWSYPVSYYDDGEQLADLSSSWSATWQLKYGPSNTTALLELTPTCDGAGNTNPPNILVEVTAAQSATLTAGHAWQVLTISDDTGQVIRVLEGAVRIVP